MAQERRRCGRCGEGELRPIREQALRGFGRETTWQCDACELTVKLLSPGGRLLMGALALVMTGAVPYAAVTSRVARESQRPWIVALIALLALALVVLFVRDTARQRRHPGLPRGSKGETDGEPKA